MTEEQQNKIHGTFLSMSPIYQKQSTLKHFRYYQDKVEDVKIRVSGVTIDFFRQFHE